MARARSEARNAAVSATSEAVGRRFNIVLSASPAIHSSTDCPRAVGPGQAADDAGERRIGRREWDSGPTWPRVDAESNAGSNGRPGTFGCGWVVEVARQRDPLRGDLRLRLSGVAPPRKCLIEMV